jgi:predicted DNA-binding transcriptional regulator YafY
MSRNKIASYRYQILDECFQQKGRYWSAKELLEVLDRRLYDDFDIEGGIKLRTLEADLKLMKMPRPQGYDAPITNRRGQGYHYTNPDFSIHKKSLDAGDRKAIREAIALLRQFKGLPHFSGLEKILLRIEGRLLSEHRAWDSIQFESNDRVAGIQWLERLYDATENRRPLLLHYHPFMAHDTQRFVIHPYLLKEYRNRWFLFGQNETAGKVYCCALDRITGIRPAVETPFYWNPDFHPIDWFKDVIGVTRTEGAVVTEIVFTTNALLGHYMVTKPLHPSQKVLEKAPDYWRFSLRVIPNYELRAELLRYGSALKLELPEDLF